MIQRYAAEICFLSRFLHTCPKKDVSLSFCRHFCRCDNEKIRESETFFGGFKWKFRGDEEVKGTWKQNVYEDFMGPLLRTRRWLNEWKLWETERRNVSNNGVLGAGGWVQESNCNVVRWSIVFLYTIWIPINYKWNHQLSLKPLMSLFVVAWLSFLANSQFNFSLLNGSKSFWFLIDYFSPLFWYLHVNDF